MTTDRTLVIVGASLAGAKAAAAARAAGFDGRVVLIGEVFRRLHADHGVKLRLPIGVAELRGDHAVEQVVLSDGEVEAADVVVGVGVTPRDELAVAAGLKVDNGIVVDEHLQSSAPAVYAAGDVASAWHPHYRRQLRVEHWANALNQGAIAGGNAVGCRESYTRLPYFFSDQYDLDMEYVGYSDPTDAIVVRAEVSLTASSSPSGTAMASSPRP